MQYVATANNLTKVTIYDWVLNEQEVVSFEGDVATLYIMSAAYEPIKQTIDKQMQAWALICDGYQQLLHNSWFDDNFALVFVNNQALGSTLTVWYRFIWIILVACVTVATICLSSPNFYSENHWRYDAAFIKKRSIFFAGESMWFYYILQELVCPITYWGILCSSGSIVLWIVIGAIDVFSPLTAQASLSRARVNVDMYIMIYCQSGEIHVGSFPRLCIIAGVQTGWVVLTSLIHYRLNCDDNRSLLVPPIILAQIQSREIVKLDSVTSLMCGLVHVPGAFLIQNYGSSFHPIYIHMTKNTNLLCSQILRLVLQIELELDHPDGFHGDQHSSKGHALVQIVFRGNSCTWCLVSSILVVLL
ncbi:hypothetical protein THRCLA_06962 [Thraustotheca clavata]|uniref:Uncharacterized protein n=1 Tax=Thraustotheca clavata TaxID=74557 RepID=A0A1V9ZHG6_9STRA|nr:hypothetical protein THRCLA_06962 [Thraustotheca clavata]